MNPTYSFVPEWQNKNGQIMTARWLNSVVSNLDWIYNCALFGNPPFRIVKETGDSAIPATWKIIWQGSYYHINANLYIKYDLIRTVSATEGAYNYKNDYDSIFGSDVSDPFGPLSDGGELLSTDFAVCIYVAGVWYMYWGGTWNLIADPGDNTDTLAHAVPEVDKTDQAIIMSLSSLNLTVGTVYPVQIRGRNGGFRIQNLCAYGSASYSYVALPTVTDGERLLHSDWNKYVSSLRYLKQLVDVPRGPTWGVLRRKIMGTGPQVVWRGNLKHVADTLAFRIGLGCIGHGMSSYLSCGGSLFWSTAGTEVSDSNPIAYYTSTVNLAALSLTPGTWYTFSYRGYAPDASAGNEGMTILDYLFQVDGEPAAALLCNRWTEGGYIYGDTAAQDPCMSSLNADFATVKTAAERIVQMPPPDSASSSATWPLATDWLYSANALSWIRQRPQVLWESTIGTTEEVQIYYGDGDKPSVQNLGLGISSGITDLDAISGLTVGTRYWMEPRAKIKYAFETGE